MSYKVRLEIFEGPLDLLLYLIKEEELDIYDIPITRITEQYLEYLNLMEMMDLDIAGDFLVMAATLMHIKSKMLLPPDPLDEVIEEGDPRAELVRRLLEYKAFKEAALGMRKMEEARGEYYTRYETPCEFGEGDIPLMDLSIFDLMNAFSKALKNLPKDDFHDVATDKYTVSDKIKDILHHLIKQPVLYFSHLFKSAESKYEAITIFLAVLELVRQKEILISQKDAFSEIQINKNNRLVQHPVIVS